MRIRNQKRSQPQAYLKVWFSLYPCLSVNLFFFQEKWRDSTVYIYVRYYVAREWKRDATTDEVFAEVKKIFTLHNLLLMFNTFAPIQRKN